MRKYALLNDNIVVSVENLTLEQYAEKIKTHQAIIDIEDMLPEPGVGYVLVGNTLQANVQMSQLQFEEALAEKKCKEGKAISDLAVIKLGAINKILNKNGTQVAQILNSMFSVKLLLETGALGTARAIISQLIAVYPEYNEIFAECITKINDFEAKYGL